MIRLLKKPLLKIPFREYQFTLTLGWLIAIVVLVPILLRLSLWQLQRAEERHQAQAELKSVMTQAPIAIDDLELTQEQTLVRVTVTGEYDWSRQFLLANQVHNTVSGYEVLTPLKYAPNKAVLVSRGWIPKSPNKTPDLSPPANLAKNLTVQGLAVIPGARLSEYQREILEKTIGFEEMNDNPQLAKWPVIIQEEDFAKLSSLLKLELLPRVIQPQQDLSYGYRRVWQPSLRGPTINYGYAAQWFGMAVLLIAVMLWINTRREQGESD